MIFFDDFVPAPTVPLSAGTYLGPRRCRVPAQPPVFVISTVSLARAYKLKTKVKYVWSLVLIVIRD